MTVQIKAYIWHVISAVHDTSWRYKEGAFMFIDRFSIIASVSKLLLNTTTTLARKQPW